MSLCLCLWFILRTLGRVDSGVKVGMVENFAQGRRKRFRKICDSCLKLPTTSQHDPGTLLKRRCCCQPVALPRLKAEGAQLPGRGNGLPASSARASLCPTAITYVDDDGKFPDASENVVPDSWGGRRTVLEPLAQTGTC